MARLRAPPASRLELGTPPGSYPARRSGAQRACALYLRMSLAYHGAMARSSLIASEVLEIMRRPDAHCWTLDELLQALSRRGVTPNPSSVFRAVSGLEQAGALVRVPLGDGRSHYELAAKHHDHLVCDACGRVEPLACFIVEGLASRARTRSGFVISGHQLVLSGTCRACARSASEPAGDRRRGQSGARGDRP